MQTNKKANSRRKYDKEFKEDVMRMVQNGRSVRDVSESLGIGVNMVYRWRNALNGPVSSNQNSMSQSNTITVSPGELEQLRAKLREVEQERDILKKALDIFSRGN